MWSLLRGLSGPKFFRQVLVHGYIADFLAPRIRLLVEVDGGSHKGRETYDKKRDAILASYGYRTLRVAAGRVLHCPGEVIKDVRAISQRLSERSGSCI